jgi:hypothetical protein
VPLDARWSREVELLERPESAQERALETISVVRGGLEGGVDLPRSALREGYALVMPERRDEISARS